MKKNHFKPAILVAVSLLLVVTMFAGCGGNTGGSSAPASTAAPASSTANAPDSAPAGLDPVTLKLYLFGDKREQTDNVFKKLADDFREELNCDYEVNFIAGTDYKQKLITLAASGDNWDINFDGDWLSYSIMVNNGAYMDVKPLLAEYAPELSKVYDESGILDAISVDGKAYALPWTMRMNQRYYVQWSKEYADKAGLTFENDSIKTVEDLDVLLTALRQAYPDKKINELTNGERIFYAKDELTELPYMFVVDTKADKPVVRHYAMTDTYLEHAKWSKKWQDDGIIWKDILTNQLDVNSLIQEGEVISNVSWHEWVNCVSNWGGIIGTPDQNRYYSLLYPDNQYANRTPLANVAAINANAKNPERAMMFLNMIEKDQQFYDTLQYGIEGVTYVLGPNGEAEYPTPDMNGGNSNYMEWGGQWAFWKPQFMRPNATYPKDFWKNEADFASLPANVNSKLVGFFPDLSSVENELIMVASTFDEMNKSINVGLVKDSDATVLELRDKLMAAGLEKVTAEYQRQIDEFMAKK